MTRTRGQHHGDLRAALMTAALEIIAGSDPDALTLREVARRAGVSPAAPYHHFEDKSALLAAVALDGFRELAAVQAAVRSRSPLARVGRLTGSYIRFALEHQSHYAVMIDALRSSGGADRSLDEGGELASAARSTFDTLAAAVSASRPDLSHRSTRARAFQVWSLAHGTVELVTVGQALGDELDEATVIDGASAAARAIVSASPGNDDRGGRRS